MHNIKALQSKDSPVTIRNCFALALLNPIILDRVADHRAAHCFIDDGRNLLIGLAFECAVRAVARDGDYVSLSHRFVMVRIPQNCSYTILYIL